MKKPDLKAESYIILNGKEKSLKYLDTSKQKILEKISQILSNYYTSHPDEINNLK